MHVALYILLGLAALGVLFVLGRGVVAMASGKDVTGQQSNKFMTYRVGLQFAAVIIVVVLLLLNRH